MHVFRIIGKLWPAFDADIKFADAYHFFNDHHYFGKMQIIVYFTNGLVNVEIKCVKRESDVQHGYLLNIARDYVNNILYINTLYSGISKHFLPEAIVDDKGYKYTFSRGRDAFADISERFFSEPNRLQEMISFVAPYSQSHKIISDLFNAIETPNSAPFFCSSAVEATRIALSPHLEDRSAGWAAMRHKLNISEKYLKTITGLSSRIRHGHYDHVPHTIVEPIVDATCVVAIRYFEYCFTKDCDHLSLDDFPVL